MFLLPLVVVNQTFIQPLSFTLLILSDQFHSLVNLLRLRKNPATDILPTIRALLLPQQTLRNALLTEGMTTNSSSAADNEVHAYAALKCLLI